MLILGAPLGFIIYMMFSAMGPFMTELYPTEVRGAGQGFCYNSGRAMGALFPALVGFLSDRLGLGQRHPAVFTAGLRPHAAGADHVAGDKGAFGGSDRAQ